MATKKETHKIRLEYARTTVFAQCKSSHQFAEGEQLAFGIALDIIGDDTVFELDIAARKWAKRFCPGHGSYCVADCHLCIDSLDRIVKDTTEGD